MNEEITHKLLSIIELHPNLSQRELAIEMCISLGKTNYCVKGLIERGWLKARNFKNCNNKIAYTYMLTSTRLSETTKITARCLKLKVNEYDNLRTEIEKLRQEVPVSSYGFQNQLPDVDKIWNPIQ